MIMERFGEDVDQIFARCSRCFHIQTVLTLAIRIIDVLEYIHKHGYVHADIKGSNLMVGYVSGKKNQVFLVDYGLAYRFNPDGVHKEYKEDPKRKHDGTIEFTSRDAHKGVAPSRRTDLEILGYVMLRWLGGKLPWEDNLTNQQYVMDSKIKHMNNIPQLIKECLKGQKSEELEDYLKYVVKLDYNEEPNYNKLRKIFQDGLRKRRLTDDGKGVVFKNGAAVSGKLSNGYSEDEEKEEFSDKEDVELSPSPVKRRKVNPKPKKGESRAPTIPVSPIKKTSRKAPIPTKIAASKKDTAKQPEKVTSPSKSPPSKPSRKRRAVDEEKPVKKSRGRARKPVMVDTATSP